MLVSCERCGRQYDAGALAPGAALRCFCGEKMTVPDRQASAAKMLHCSACGGSIRKDQKTCPYCNCELAAGERGYGEACPKCFARMLKDAKYCSSCGTRIQIEMAVKAIRTEKCPSCSGRLALCELPRGSFTECTACAGIWLDEMIFEGLLKERERSKLEAWLERNRRTEPGDAEPETGRKSPARAAVKYRACPTCGGIMHRKNFGGGSGVIVDWCKGHGYWFDADELGQIYDFVAAGGSVKSPVQAMTESQEREREELRREASKRAFLGEGKPDSTTWTPGGGGTLLDVLTEFARRMFDAR